ncbi:DUF3626 domain-containing protein [Brevibacillus fluminis]|uniref:DUF3626 domain-containing protein n=1 Tax=Brevibacillus fluminis TaxID=511487 RepID=A0A3M8D9D6_9BACL|nr:DUF3626 domain-containing protein [Brevibacillus fluminis]RNB84664.1 DUF3626 domain-containing protein [Brevibacillus fluminis]
MNECSGSRNDFTAAQAGAIRYVRGCAELMRDQALDELRDIFSRANVANDIDVAMIAQHVSRAPITLNFHPDRMMPDGRTVIDGLLREGTYRSQFVTGVTNGSRTAYPGGDRDRWEQQLFGGAYHASGVEGVDRPTYGALNVLHYADGASPRFGSCYLILKPHMTSRCTFTFGDSHAGPTRIGTMDVFEPLLAALLREVEQNGNALGTSGMSVQGVLTRLAGCKEESFEKAGMRGRALDDYIEAQIHGKILLVDDVAAIVADPAFKGTAIGEQLMRLSATHNCELRWHPGFSLAVASVPDDFRGPVMPPFARWIDTHFAKTPGLLDAADLGVAAASLHTTPELWHEWGTPDESFQLIKQLWHVIVRFG